MQKSVFRRVLCVGAILSSLAACQMPGMFDSTPPTQEQFLVFFTSEDAALSDDARIVIARAAAEVRANPPQSVVVYGFADTRGDRDVNRRLSADRAKSVAEALVEAGVQSDLVSPRGLGETSTSAPPSDLDPEGRRAEIVLVR